MSVASFFFLLMMVSVLQMAIRDQKAFHSIFWITSSRYISGKVAQVANCATSPMRHLSPREMLAFLFTLILT